jgi:predicted nucleic acid-binding protein
LKYLLDTSLVSAVRKGHPIPTAWLGRQEAERVHISVLTLGEILRGARLKAKRDPAAGMALERWVFKIRDVYESRILDLNEHIALEWGRISATRTRGEIDGLLAATAIHHDLTVATRNVAEFADTGVAVVNPWED